LVIARPQRWSLWAKVQGSTVVIYYPKSISEQESKYKSKSKGSVSMGWGNSTSPRPRIFTDLFHGVLIISNVSSSNYYFHFKRYVIKWLLKIDLADMTLTVGFSVFFTLLVYNLASGILFSLFSHNEGCVCDIAWLVATLLGQTLWSLLSKHKHNWYFRHHTISKYWILEARLFLFSLLKM